jgi:hypothetical protein
VLFARENCFYKSKKINLKLKKGLMESLKNELKQELPCIAAAIGIKSRSSTHVKWMDGGHYKQGWKSI